MTSAPAQRWRTTLRSALLQARKQRDTVRVAALRSALGAIDNAETPDMAETHTRIDGPIAHSVAGLGAAEVARRALTEAEVLALLHAEIDERISAATQFSAGGHGDRAARLRAEAAVLDGFLTGP
ncbi:GatB/YqeY domain-containing protein [Mycolicibacterium canariasense]|nr:GatB/YqeY domain-containing protein [Mycolicibacterium canariasense]MCV7209445.1 GatB/YqeY domain-containing protein [Mycolicibacterium canariasense]ORV06101.1 glutamyl-tRNA amidotransferase [Mycolicibacterium canariasense]